VPIQLSQQKDEAIEIIKLMLTTYSTEANDKNSYTQRQIEGQIGNNYRKLQQ